jgi:hypothetical protein
MASDEPVHSLMGPLLFLYAYDVWQKKRGLG